MRVVLHAAARRIAPDAWREPATAAAFSAALDDRIALLTPVARRRLASALLIFDSPLTALLTRGSLLRFTALADDEQDAVLLAWQSARSALLRRIYQSIRRLVVGTWYTQPAAQHAVGYLGPYHLRAPAVAWEGPLPGVTRDDEPVQRGAAAPGVPDAPLPTASLAGASGTAHEQRLRADVCVIGSGAGGAVVAARLAEAGFDVVLLEEGSYLAPAELDEDEGRMTARLYAEGGARTTDDIALGLLQGRTVGGGTTVNWMLMLETPDHVLDEWEHEHGATLLGQNMMRPALALVGEEVHARLVPPDAHNPSNRVILRGAERLGWAASAARINARGCIRTGLCGLGCRYHAKQSTLAVYVPRALRAGARLCADARAERIELREPTGAGRVKRVHAVTLDRTGTATGTLVIDAAIVVLAAGAVGTPALLQRSGLGGDGVGEWLRLHPTSAVAGLYDEPIYQAAGIPQSAVCTELHTIDEGYGLWIECPPFLPGIAAVATPGFGAAHAERMRHFRHTAALILLARDGHARRTSNGRVRARRGGGIRIDYALGPHEWKLVRAGMRAAAQLHLAAGASEVTTLHSDLPALRNEQDLQYIDSALLEPNRIGLFSAHVNGTCRIGSVRRDSGCSPDAERWGVPGLYVADGAVLPTAPAVNPQWTIMAVATVIAAHIAARHRPG